MADLAGGGFEKWNNPVTLWLRNADRCFSPVRLIQS